MAKNNEKLLAVLTRITPIVGSIIGYFLLIPKPIRANTFFKILAIAVLIIGSVFICRWLYSKLKPATLLGKIQFYGLFIIIVATTAISMGVEKDRKKETLATTIAYKTASNNIQNNSGDVNNNLHFDSSSNNHVIIGNGNTVGINGDVTNNYINSKPVPRKLYKKIMEHILGQIPSTGSQIQINYPANDPEAANLGNQIFEKLFDLGYSHVTKGQLDGSVEYAKDWITIKKITPQQTIQLIVNAQQ